MRATPQEMMMVDPLPMLAEIERLQAALAVSHAREKRLRSMFEHVIAFLEAEGMRIDVADYIDTEARELVRWLRAALAPEEEHPT
jgi:hypothetical protein